MEQSKRLTKEDMVYEIGSIEAYHPATLYWDTLKHDEIRSLFNDLFGTAISWTIRVDFFASFFFHEPKSDAVKKKQKANYIIFLFIDKGNYLQVIDS